MNIHVSFKATQTLENAMTVDVNITVLGAFGAHQFKYVDNNRWEKYPAHFLENYSNAF